MSTNTASAAPAWRKSTHSGEQNCVEVAINTPQVHVRDTKNREGAELRIDRHAWAEFTTACRRGRFSR